jgi:hypothetical protein
MCVIETWKTKTKTKQKKRPQRKQQKELCPSMSE